MTRLLYSFALVGLCLFARAAAPAIQGNVQARVGYDSNSIAVDGAAAALLQDEGTLVYGGALAVSAQAKATRSPLTAQLSYAADATRFDANQAEDFSTHRLGFTARHAAAWTTALDLSALYVNGNDETLLAVAACNANATTLWRERREQLQYRGRLTSSRDWAALRVRLHAAWLEYDYHTLVRSGYTAFTDRAERLVGADLGGVRGDASFWFIGARVGAQSQDTVPLPGGAYEYSNRLVRAVVGWEGKLSRDTRVAVAAGPDFRRYDGAVDPRASFQRGRTFAWFEASLTTALSPKWTASLKASRWTWLSSTGKAAYTDFASELGLTRKLSSQTVVRASAKAHRCSYFPIARDDWEYLGAIGVSHQLTARWELSLDALRHIGRNAIPGSAERAFERSVVSLSTTFKL